MSDSKVFVYANLSNGQSFIMPDKRIVIFNGYPVSKLVLPNGGSIPGGMFGVTEIWRDDWDWIYKHYSYMGMFKIGLVFMAETKEKGDAMAKERESLRHGNEQINVVDDSIGLGIKPYRDDSEYMSECIDDKPKIAGFMFDKLKTLETVVFGDGSEGKFKSKEFLKNPLVSIKEFFDFIFKEEYPNAYELLYNFKCKEYGFELGVLEGEDKMSINEFDKLEITFCSLCTLLKDGYLSGEATIIEGDGSFLVKYREAWDKPDYRDCVHYMSIKVPSIKFKTLETVMWIMSTAKGKKLLPNWLKKDIKKLSKIHKKSDKYERKPVSIKQVVEDTKLSESTIKKTEKDEKVHSSGYHRGLRDDPQEYGAWSKEYRLKNSID